MPRKKTVSKSTGSKLTKSLSDAQLRKKLSGMTKESLIDLVMRLPECNQAIQKEFYESAFSQTICQTDNRDDLTTAALELADSCYAEDADSAFSHRCCMALADYSKVKAIIVQLGKLDNPLTYLDKIVRRVIQNGCELTETTDIESFDEYEEISELAITTLIQAGISPVELLKWIRDIQSQEDYGLTDGVEEIVFKHKWDKNGNREIADFLLNEWETKTKGRTPAQLQALVQALDKAGRKEEATTVLQKDAELYYCHNLLKDRLAKQGTPKKPKR